MNPKYKIIIKEYLILKTITMDKVLFHENEADKYRKQYIRFGREIERIKFYFNVRRKTSRKK